MIIRNSLINLVFVIFAYSALSIPSIAFVVDVLRPNTSVPPNTVIQDIYGVFELDNYNFAPTFLLLLSRFLVSVSHF